MEDQTAKDVLSAYHESMRPHSITEVKIFSDFKDDKILYWDLKTSQRSPQRKKIVSYSTIGSVNTENFDFQMFPYSSETDEFASAYSTCGQMKAVVIEVNEDNRTKQYMEIWHRNAKLKSFDLAAEETHGKILKTPYFKCLKWSHDGNKILYIAENKPTSSTEQRESLVDANYLNKSNQHNVEDIKNKFVYEDNWGEELERCREPTLCLLEVSNGKIVNLYENMPRNISISQAFWSKDDEYIIFSGYLTSPWRHGLSWCVDRQSGIYAYKFSSKTLKTVVECRDSVYNLTVSPDRSKLLFLTCPALSQCTPPLLKRIKLSDSKSFSFESPKIINCSIKHFSEENKFPGFGFQLNLVSECWLDDQTIIFQCENRSHFSLYYLNTVTGDITLLEKEGDWRLLGIKSKIIFAMHSSPTVPHTYKIGRTKYKNKKVYVEWKNVYEFHKVYNDISWKVLQHKPTSNETNESLESYESIVIQPKDKKRIKGLIVFPHGGPQVCWSTQFCFKVACLAKLGYAVQKVNYRGSPGFSKNSVESITGNIADQEVEEVHKAALEAVEDLEVPNNNVFVTGGSWGGSIGLFLAAKYPDIYKAVGMRNPVCNIPYTAVSSDIPEWAYNVCGIPYANNAQPNVENYTEMLLKSPTFIADRINTPVVFFVGENDRRVPRHQSVELFRILKANGVKVKMFLYPNNTHRIGEFEMETDMFVNQVLWFHEHLVNEKE